MEGLLEKLSANPTLCLPLASKIKDYGQARPLAQLCPDRHRAQAQVSEAILGQVAHSLESLQRLCIPGAPGL